MIMSVKEARKIMGMDAAKFSDDEIEKLINDLDSLAGMAIKQFKEHTMSQSNE